MCRRPIRPVASAAKCAASMTRSVEFSSISVAIPPSVPASEIGPEESVIRTSSGSSSRTT